MLGTEWWARYETVAEVLSNTSVGVASFQLAVGAIYLVSVPFAYRQNRRDRGESQRVNEVSARH